MNDTQKFTDFIRRDQPCLYAKFGDGEYLACVGSIGFNCDRDAFTPTLQKKLLNAFRYFCSTDAAENVHLGRWMKEDIVQYYESLVPSRVPWMSYVTLLVHEHSFENRDTFELYRAIKENKRKKYLLRTTF